MLISIKKDSDEVYSNTDCFLPIVGLSDNDSESEFSFSQIRQVLILQFKKTPLKMMLPMSFILC